MIRSMLVVVLAGALAAACGGAPQSGNTAVTSAGEDQPPGTSAGSSVLLLSAAVGSRGPVAADRPTLVLYEDGVLVLREATGFVQLQLPAETLVDARQRLLDARLTALPPRIQALVPFVADGSTTLLHTRAERGGATLLVYGLEAAVRSTDESPDSLSSARALEAAAPGVLDMRDLRDELAAQARGAARQPVSRPLPDLTALDPPAAR